MTPAVRAIDVVAGDAGTLLVVARMMGDVFDPRYGEAWTSGQCLGMLALPGSWLALAVDGDDVLGFALARVVAGDGELLLLGVDPAARRRGIGGALLRAVIAEAAARDGARLHLEVRSGNAATALYRAHGFRQVGRRRDYYRGADGTVHDALTFARALVDDSSPLTT